MIAPQPLDSSDPEQMRQALLALMSELSARDDELHGWFFAGSLRAGKCATAVMSLVHSARINGHDPYAYLRDVLERLPTQPASRIEELLEHRWQTA